MSVADRLKRIVYATPALHATVTPVYRGAVAAVSAARYAAYRAPSSSARLPRETGAPRVVLDGAIFPQRVGGIPRMWRAVMEEWSANGFARQVVVLDREATAPRLPGFTYRRVPSLRTHDHEPQRRMLERICRTERADVFVSTFYTHPTDTPTLLVVHDLTPETLGYDPHEPLTRERRAAYLRADSFVCISRNTEADLLAYYPSVSTRPRRVVPLGVSGSFSPRDAAQVEAFRTRLDLPGEYFLFLGDRTSRKNAELLFAAVQRGGLPPGAGVLLVGGRPTLEARYAAVGERYRVHLAGHLSDDDMVTAYSGAAALLYLSVAEGFGLPVLEAMACGCPVIAAATTAIPEAAGDAAVLVDPDDVDGLVRAMTGVLDTGRRDGLVSAGLARASCFPWARTAGGIEQALRGTTQACRSQSSSSLTMSSSPR